MYPVRNKTIGTIGSVGTNSSYCPICVYSDGLGKQFRRIAVCGTIQFEKNHQQFMDVRLVHRLPAQITPFFIRMSGHRAHLYGFKQNRPTFPSEERS